jgi:hypothetical protein
MKKNWEKGGTLKKEATHTEKKEFGDSERAIY